MANCECVRCRRFFEKVAFEEVCPICFPVEENEFAKIKEYLTLHPGANSSVIMNELNVSLKSIRRYLKEDRLEILGDNKGFIRCELCGKALNSGRFCESCFKEGLAMRRNEAGAGLKSSFHNQSDLQKSSQGKGIRYSEKHDKKG